MKRLGTFLITAVCVAIMFGAAVSADVVTRPQAQVPPVESEPYDPCGECPHPVAGLGTYVQDGVGYFEIMGSIGGIDFRDFLNATLVFDRYGVDKMVIVINSPGGGLFDGLAIAQKIIEEQGRGKIVEVRGYGLVASAASIIMAVGSKGHRYIAPDAILMIHELQVLEWEIGFKGVSDKEREARIVRFLQDNMEDFLVPHIKLTAEELARKCAEESWGDAETAIKWGFADKLIE